MSFLKKKKCTKECGICMETLNKKKNRIKLKCKHRFCKTCISGLSEYKPGDFVAEYKHVCPLCQITKIKLDKHDLFHSKIINTKTGYLDDIYKNLKKSHTHYRFCKNTNCCRLFIAGDNRCDVDKETLRDFCLGCDPINRIRLCPNTNCNTLIEWLSGCNSMTCVKCKTHFCFVHGKTIETIRQEYYSLTDSDINYLNIDMLKHIEKKNNKQNIGINDCVDCLRELREKTQISHDNIRQLTKHTSIVIEEPNEPEKTYIKITEMEKSKDLPNLGKITEDIHSKPVTNKISVV